MMFLMQVLISLGLIAILWQRLKNSRRQQTFRRNNACCDAPTTPQFDRILGLDLMLRDSRSMKEGRLLADLGSRFEDVGYTHSTIIAGRHCTFTIEPENLKAIFADKFNDFDVGWIRRRAFAPAFGETVITANGPKWHQQRTKLRPAFGRQQFSDYKFFEHDVQSLIESMPADGSPVDMAPLFHVHALNLAARLLFDEPVASFKEEFANSSKRFLDALHIVQLTSLARIRSGRLLLLKPCGRSYKAACEILHEYGDAFVRKALESKRSGKVHGAASSEKPQQRYIFLQELARDIDDPIELRNHLLSMLLVGSETTASLLINCLSILSTKQDLWSRMRNEILCMGSLKYEGIKDSTLLNQVMKEVLRLYPVLPLIGRSSNKDTYLPTGGGLVGKSRVFVPNGSTVTTSTYSLHRRKDIFGSDADEFRPERWASLKTLSQWTFIPFGGGPRVCLGQQYALTEVYYTLVGLLREYSVIESHDPRPWREQPGISFTNANGAKVSLRSA